MLCLVPDRLRSSPLALTVLALLHYRPLHPYGVQRLIRLWGKDQVVNVAQRTSLYRTMERLAQAGLITARGAERAQAYPERTVYEVTQEGRDTARRWLEEMLAVPRNEYPEFPAALSHLLLLEPETIADVLRRRIDALSARLAEHDTLLSAEGERGLPRITMLETEYVRAMTAAEIEWLESVTRDLQSDRLTWTPDQLLAIADALEPTT
jgi:DNA-binding PadR family transcriptional regulator